MTYVSSNVVSVVQRLNQFTHGSRTNVHKRIMNNRGASALVLALNGPMSLKDSRDTLMTWRLGQAEYKRVKEVRYVVEAGRVELNTIEAMGKLETREIVRPTMTFAAYFSLNNQYSHTGMSFDSPPRDVIAPSSWNPRNGGSWVNYVRFKRLPYWFRLCRGYYAITVGGLKRLHSLGLVQS